ncbi:MAG: hypothetical protein AVDCRST_MAG04-1229 [uncultured Acetobacteraceae bacterium]|uniref:Uncharacterized protein n=1 Tax=uncultured Acetobacteraceae bacterium TaxID=169975 RepID=A0A6J4HUP2_9PROT|nr:MAG: hypothetical protein AVDCRST_MAG04-1229 [uncultured Acetobacteraceae bacterium]
MTGGVGALSAPVAHSEAPGAGRRKGGPPVGAGCPICRLASASRRTSTAMAANGVPHRAAFDAARVWMALLW